MNHSPSSCLRITRLRAALLMALFALGLGACVTQSQSFWDTDRIVDLQEMLADGNMDQAEFLIERYDNVLSNQMALDLSIREGNVKGVRHFVASSSVNRALDPDGVTPLIRAVREAPSGSREEIIRALLKAGADPTVNDNFGRNAANYAAFGGDMALATFLESQGTSYYSSRPAERTAWLPQVDLNRVLNADAGVGKRQSNPVLSRSPLTRSRAGRPDLLFASTWIPGTNTTTDGPYAGLRFHADGTGEVLEYYPRGNRFNSGVQSHMAWDYHRDDLYFMVLTEQYASYCRSIGGGPGKFGVNCTDYSAAGGNLAAALSTRLSAATARQLLNDATARGRLQEVGKTNSLLEPAVDRVCKPRLAGKRVREGLPLKAASTRKVGDWVVFDARRFASYSAENELVCTQREARTAAFEICKASGGNCRSVGGCRDGKATVVASLQGHGWAWVGCDKNVDVAKALALAECRKKSGCDCQVVYASAKPPEGPEEICRARRG